MVHTRTKKNMTQPVSTESRVKLQFTGVRINLGGDINVLKKGDEITVPKSVADSILKRRKDFVKIGESAAPAVSTDMVELEKIAAELNAKADALAKLDVDLKKKADELAAKEAATPDPAADKPKAGK